MDAFCRSEQSFEFIYHYSLPENCDDENRATETIQLPLGSNVTVRECAFRFMKKHNLPEYLFPDLFQKLQSFVDNRVDELQCQHSNKSLEFKEKLGDKYQDFWLKMRSGNNFGSFALENKRKDNLPHGVEFYSMYHEVIHSGILTPQLIQLENHNSEVIRNLLQEREEYLENLTREQSQTIETILVSGSYSQKEINSIMQNNILLAEKLRKETKEKIEKVRQDQKHEFSVWIRNTYEDWIKGSGNRLTTSAIVSIENHSKELAKGNFVDFISAGEEAPMEESYTINLGSQLKTTHNLRLISVDILQFCSNICTPHRLQTAMSLYSDSLAAIVLLHDKSAAKSGIISDFGRLCQNTSENHFADFEMQLAQINSDVYRAKRDPDSNPLTQLNVGDVFISRHSNFAEAHVVFHVVVDDTLRSPEINSRHPVILGIRNILKIAYIYDIALISIPLLLLHNMNEDITIQWCLRRAELVLKCVKGFMIEMSSLLSPKDENKNKTIQFVVPKGISQELFSSLSAIFPSVFRLSNTLFLTTNA